MPEVEVHGANTFSEGMDWVSLRWLCSNVSSNTDAFEPSMARRYYVIRKAERIKLGEDSGLRYQRIAQA